MSFKLDLLDLPPIKQVTTPTHRFYVTPDGSEYPSVTTIISKMSDKSWLDDWINKVGEKEANRVTKRSSTRGTAVHRLCEQYILNRDIDLKREMPINKKLFLQLKSLLTENVSDIRASEAGLYSDRLKAAGTVDLIGSFRNKPSVIDFKTSTNNKLEEDIEGYFIQTAIYSYMLWERTGIVCKYLVILIAIENENKPQMFIDKVSNWVDRSVNMVEGYYGKEEV